MAYAIGNRSSSNINYIYDLPYIERKELCNILDQNQQWERLGGEFMDYRRSDLQEMKRAERSGNSPSDALLEKWGHQNNTIARLFALLRKMEHFQAMRVLLPFIPEKHHHLVKENDYSLTTLQLNGSESCRNNSMSSISEIPLSLGHSLQLHSKRMERNGLRPSNRNTVNSNTTRSLSRSSTNQSTNNTINQNLNVNQGQKIVEKIPNFLLAPVTSSQSTEAVSIEDNNANQVSQTGSPQGACGIELRDNLNVSNNPFRQANNYQQFDGHGHQLREKKRINQDNNFKQNGEGNPYKTEGKCSPETYTNLSQSLEKTTLPPIPYNELEKATNGWDEKQMVGKGGFARVYKGMWKNTKVAIKRIDFHPARAVEELLYIHSYQHHNILQAHGYSLNKDHPLCIVYQFMQNGTVEDRLLCRNVPAFHVTNGQQCAQNPLTWFQRLNIAKGTAAALQYLHSVKEKALVHGDVKTANILLDLNLDPKLGDFGLAKEGPPPKDTSMQVPKCEGSRPYVPDEYLRNKRLSKEVDTYSYGVVMFELATGLRALDKGRERQYLKDHVEDTLSIDSLRDEKADHDYCNIFTLLYKIGKECVAEKHQRPQMVNVYEKIEEFICTNRPVENNTTGSLNNYYKVLPMPTTSTIDPSLGATNMFQHQSQIPNVSNPYNSYIPNMQQQYPHMPQHFNSNNPMRSDTYPQRPHAPSITIPQLSPNPLLHQQIPGQNQYPNIKIPPNGQPCYQYSQPMHSPFNQNYNAKLSSPGNAYNAMLYNQMPPSTNPFLNTFPNDIAFKQPSPPRPCFIPNEMPLPGGRVYVPVLNDITRQPDKFINKPLLQKVDESIRIVPDHLTNAYANKHLLQPVTDISNGINQLVIQKNDAIRLSPRPVNQLIEQQLYHQTSTDANVKTFNEPVNHNQSESQQESLNSYSEKESSTISEMSATHVLKPHEENVTEDGAFESREQMIPNLSIFNLVDENEERGEQSENCVSAQGKKTLFD